MEQYLFKEFSIIEKAASFVKIDDPKNTYLLGVQHLSYSTSVMFKFLIERGFLAKNIYLLGKCYSTNPYAVKILEDLGVNVSHESNKFNSHKNFDEQFDSYTNHYFSKIFKILKGKTILLDDGAALLKLASKLPLKSDIVAIEQTSAGYHRAKLLKNLSFPIINVARSDIKLNYESIFICRMISYKVSQLINKNFKDNYSPRILIIGAGKIGLGVLSFIKTRYFVDIVDLERKMSDFDINELDERLFDYDVVIGATGNCSISENKYQFLKPGAILISCSSSDREFDSVKIRKKIPLYFNCHRSIKVDGITLVNSGFPVNFDNSYLDSKEFQLTRALLIFSIDQALKTNGFSKESFLELKNAEDIYKIYLEKFPESNIGIKKSEHEITF